MTTQTVSEEHKQQAERLPQADSTLQSRGNRKRTIYGGVAILLLVVIGTLAYPKATEEIAYVRGIEAYTYGLPLVMMDVSNRVMTNVPKSSDSRAPINQFWRMRKHVTPDYTDIVRVSSNSLWSVAVMDLDKEPLVVSHPDTNGRFIIIQLMNMWTDDFGSLGSRATGTAAGNFLVVGPKWKGTPPPDIRDVFRSATRSGWILVQIASKGPEDYAVVNALQDQLKITPLSAWGKPYTPPDTVPVDPAVDDVTDPFNQLRLMDAGTFFNRLAHLMVDNPPYPADGPMLEKLKKIGVEPGKDFDINKLDPNVVKGLKRVPAEAWSLLAAGAYTLKVPNGWIIGADLGRFGTDYTNRALCSYIGIGALTQEDVIYPTTFVDSDGNPLLGTHKYVLHLPKGELFPSDSGVWSISQYRENFYVPNSLNRYGLLSSMPLKYNEDGSLDIYFQALSPGADKESNWLPLPKSGPVNVSIRVYQPKRIMYDGNVENNAMVGPATYTIPPLKRVD